MQALIEDADRTEKYKQEKLERNLTKIGLHHRMSPGECQSDEIQRVISFTKRSVFCPQVKNNTIINGTIFNV